MITKVIIFEGKEETISINKKNQIFYASDKIWCAINKVWEFQGEYSVLKQEYR